MSDLQSLSALLHRMVQLDPLLPIAHDLDRASVLRLDQAALDILFRELEAGWVQ